MTQVVPQHMDELREIVAAVLELDPEEVTETGSFADDYEADSLRAIEMLARIEKKYHIDIPQTELPKMVDLGALYRVVAEHAGWQV